ncbi:hypothetical protein A6A19_02635 [Actinobacillus delphinicola]|uniref:Uncharacterized protein conserved in bacteria n=1 Tax=Actinobacillus delphinicola TaxID=51161 RepID=A0A448TS52_9PAST|nr:DUF305 domain-containing protein [Actinobacillus delphinicola]MDG6896923.1 hypothetical protein [Actinobacillus delphinicola]VEJ08736.1 Uncharacterized protein conserved in bacteria [Actinobacillus delphinicola]
MKAKMIMATSAAVVLAAFSGTAQADSTLSSFASSVTAATDSAVHQVASTAKDAASKTEAVAKDMAMKTEVAAKDVASKTEKVAKSAVTKAEDTAKSAAHAVESKMDAVMHKKLDAGMKKMETRMAKGMAYNNPDYAFAAGMLPHHVGAVDMAKVELRFGKDPEMRALAKNIIAAQKKEIKEMHHWLKKHKALASQKSSDVSVKMHQELKVGMEKMDAGMMKGMAYNNPDIAFAAGMLPHHVGAVDMAKVELEYGKNPQMRALATSIIKSQTAQIKQMHVWLGKHGVQE